MTRRAGAHTTTSIAAVIAMVLALIPLAPVPAQAATLNVPGDHATIGAAVSAASSGDLILVAPGTYQENIFVGGKNLTIRSSGGAGVTTINPPGPGVRMLTVNTGIVELDGFTLSGGNLGASNPGGAVWVNNIGGTLTIRNSALSGNTAPDGGAITNWGTLNLFDSSVSGNTATGSGGGIYNVGTLAITRSSISNNDASSNGGGVYQRDSTLGIPQELRLVDSSIVDNTALRAGGIHAGGDLVIVQRSTIDSNTSSQQGGGIYVDPDTPVTVDASTISGNDAPGNVGGGIYVAENVEASGSLNILNSTISGNSAEGGGEGIHVFPGSSVWLDSVTIANHVGFGLVADDGSSVTVDHSALAGNNGAGADCSGLFSVSSGYNVVEDGGTPCLGLNGNENSVLGVVVGLGPLADNGGPTLTHLPNPSSPVVDLVSCEGGVDQRGVVRPFGDGCDAGSVEIEVVAPNNPPVANDDVAVAARNTGVLIPVLDNDTDADGDELFVGAFTGVQPIGGGNFDCSTPCTFWGPVGQAGWGYQASDGTDVSNNASVSVTVRESFGAEGTAVIDGSFDEGEWDQADSFGVAIETVDGVAPGTFYVMNDDTNLYVALQIEDVFFDYTDEPTLQVAFDEDGSGALDFGEDMLELSGNNSEGWFSTFTDGHFEFFEEGSGFVPDAFVEASNDGQGAVDGFSTTTFEISHPLTGDEFDISTQPGETIAFQATFSLGFGFESPTTVIPDDPGTLDWVLEGSNGVLDVVAIDVDDTELEAGFAVPLAELPPERLVDGATTIAGAPMGAIALNESPMGSIPMGAIPMGAIATNGQILLSEIPIDGGWEPLLVGTVFEGRPLQTLTLDQVAPVLDPVDLAALDLSSIRFGNTAWADLSLAAMMLGDVPLQDMCSAAVCGPNSVLDIETSGGSIAGAPIGAIPMGAIPMGAIGDIQGAPMGAIPMGAIPMGSIPMGAIGDILANPIGAIPMGAIGNLAADFTTIPMGAIPMGAIPMGAIPIGAIPIGAIPIGAIGGGCSGSVDCSFPDVTDETTVDEYVVATGSSDLQSSPMGAIPVEELPIGSIPMGAIPIGAIPMGAIPMGAIATTSAPMGAIPIGAINTAGGVDACNPSDHQGVDSASCSDTQTLREYAAAYTGPTLEGTPMGAITLADLPIGSIPMGAIDLANVEIAGVPMGAIELDSIDLSNSPIGAIPIGAIGSAICNPSVVATTLLEAAALGALCDDATLADIDPAELAALTLADILGHLTLGFLGQIVELAALTYGTLVVSILLAIDFPWEDLPLEDIETRDVACDFDLSLRSCTRGAGLEPSGLGEPDVADVNVEFTIEDGPVSGEVIDVTIPDGWLIMPGSSMVVQGDVEGAPEVTVLADPRDQGEGQFTFVIPRLFPGEYTLTFAVAPDFELGSGFTVTADETEVPEGPVILSLVTTPTMSVVEGLEFGDFASSAADLLPDYLYLGYISESGDEDWWSVDAPEPGFRVSVYLSNLNGDVDTFVYRPATAPVGSDTATRDIPLAIQPIDDDDIDLGGGGNLSPELLGDSSLDVPAGHVLGDGSTNRGTADEFAEFTSRDGDNGGSYDIQVAGFQGATSDSPYVLRSRYRAEVPTPACDPRVGVGAVGGSMPAIPANVDTVFLVNWDRMEDLYPGEVGPLQGALQAFATSTVGGVPVNGVVVPVGAIGGVSNAYADWDQNPCDPAAANAVADLIVEFVQQTASDHPSLRHVAIIGGDESIPFVRLADEAIIANEDTYVEGFGDNALYGAHFTRHYLSDAPYGDLDPIPWLDRFAYLKDLGVGRLVETPDHIEAALQTFTATDGLLSPETTAVAGYDFLTDGSKQVESNLSGLTDIDPTDGLINENWSATDLANTAYGAGVGPAADVISPNAHYDHYRALPASENLNQTETNLFTIDDITGLSPDSLVNRVVFTMGCHGGLNVDDLAGGTIDNPDDFPEIYGWERAIYIGNTGYGYGDTATVALSEQVMANLAANLGNGQTIGQNLSQAGQQQFGNAGLYGVYDLKAIEEATLYGLPMWRVEVNGASPIGTNGSETGPVGVETETGLQAAGFSTSPSFSSTPTDDGTFYSTEDGTQFMHWRPLTPKQHVDVTQDGLIATGSVLTSLVSRDVPLIDAVFARPNTTDGVGRQPEVEFNNVIFPTTFSTLGTFELLNPSTAGGPTTMQQRLNLLVGQYIGPTSTQRLFDQVDGLVYYANEGDAVDWTPPVINNVDANVVGNQVSFLVDASDAESLVSRVLVLYRSSEAAGVSTWTSLDLIPLPDGTWAGGGTFDSASITPPLDYIVQVVNGDGVNSVGVFKGDLYQAEVVPDEPTVNQPPVLGPIDGADAPSQLGLTVSTSATVSDDGPGSLTAVWSWGDGETSNGGIVNGTVTGSHVYESPGVYRVRLVVVDGAGAVAEVSHEFAVIYDPSGGFVTGGGWIDSPEGAYAADPTLTGKASFGFVAKYKKGKSVPEGNTNFKFKAGDLKFESSSYEWLVVSGSGHKARFKGEGTVNGAGDYGFMISAIDAANTSSTESDLFRIKIWNKSAGDAVVYDNLMGADDLADPTTALGGGSIVIHTGKGPK